MKGMSPQQYGEVLQFIWKHCKFGYIPGERQYPDGPKMIKYVDTTWDSRFGDIWSITFRGDGVRLATNHYVGDEVNKAPFDNLYDWCMAYLKGEWVPSKDFINEDI